MKKTFSILLNLFVGVMSFGAWIFMGLQGGDARQLASAGIESLKYFTVLSNLLNGCVSLFYAVCQMRGTENTRRKKTVKLVAVSAVGLTFVTVMVFLGPLYGYRNMMQGANLWMHLLLPLLSFGSFLFLEQGVQIPRRNSLYAVIPTVLYAAVYLTNIGINGKGTWPNTNDFYGFLNWGNGIGAVIAVSILLVAWILALVLGTLGKAFRNR